MMSVQLQQQADATATTTTAAAAASPVDANDPESAAEPLRNRAGDGDSSYVQCHSDSPVAWQLLDEAAVALARAQNKLIFMHIGFKACHYCHLTTQESFSKRSVASLLNSAFVPILVDREERPDVDSIYMNYIQAVHGAGGWPLNLFLTPDLEPVFGGTYWPGPSRANRCAVEDGEEPLDFLAILKKLQKVWAEQEAKCRREAQDIVLQLREFAAEGTLGAGNTDTEPPSTFAPTAVKADHPALTSTPPPASPDTTINPQPPSKPPHPPRSASIVATDLDVDLDQLEEAYAHISKTFDQANGGFNGAPKFPTPPKLSFLLRLAHFPPEVADIIGGAEEVGHATAMALDTLRALRDGGLRDHIGAGFHRYSVTADWSVPHFEKMTADNALLLGVYLDAWLSRAAAQGRAPTLADEFADVVLELGDYLGDPEARIGGRSLLQQDSMLGTSEASDSYYRRGDEHMREGAYYLWTRREFDATVRGRGDGTAEKRDGNGDGELHARIAAAHWNVKEHGNIPEEQDPNDEFINQNVLRVAKRPADLGAAFGIPPGEVEKILVEARARLRARRERERAAPEVDDKEVVAYNAMAASALARAAAVLKHADLDGRRGDGWLQSAQGVVAAIRDRLWDPETKTLARHWYRDRKSRTGALAEDYAFLIEALLDLYQVTGDEESYLRWACELQDKQIELFYDHTSAESQHTGPGPNKLQPEPGSGGFYSTVQDAPHVILRLKDGMDTSQPSVNAVSASNLFRLALMLDGLGGSSSSSSSSDAKAAAAAAAAAAAESKAEAEASGHKDYAALARETVRAFEVEMLQYPWLFTGLLGSVVSARLGGRATLAVVEGASATADQVRREFYCRPRGSLEALCHGKKKEEERNEEPKEGRKEEIKEERKEERKEVGVGVAGMHGAVGSS